MAAGEAPETWLTEEEEGEEWPSLGSHMLAGAVAGVVEHCGMFPVDTVKTHVQARAAAGAASATPPSAVAVARQLWKRRGMRSLWRGLTAMAGGVAPAHAVYFASYEWCKEWSTRTDGSGASASATIHPWVALWASGAVATVASDLVMTPMDVVKQRLQLGYGVQYRGTLDCIGQVWRAHGVSGFYRGLTTTLAMNVPFSGAFFLSYEIFKGALERMAGARDELRVQLAAGAGAGSVAAAITTPLDVVRTRLQTAPDYYRGMVRTVGTVWREEGMAGMSRGLGPRMLFFSTSGALCWAAYEQMKMLLGVRRKDDEAAI